MLLETMPMIVPSRWKGWDAPHPQLNAQMQTGQQAQHSMHSEGRLCCASWQPGHAATLAKARHAAA